MHGAMYAMEQAGHLLHDRSRPGRHRLPGPQGVV